MLLYLFIFTEGRNKASSLPQGVPFRCLVTDPLARCCPLGSRRPGRFALAILHSAGTDARYVRLCLLYGHAYVTDVYYQPREDHQTQRHAAGHPCI